MRQALRKSALVLGLAAAGAASAQGYGYGSGMMGTPGMMGGGGSGMMGGPGMMMGGGYSMGSYGHPLAALDLKEDQRDKIFAIQEEARSKNWGTMGQMRAEQAKLQRMYYAEKVEPKALAGQQAKVDALRRQMLQSRIETRNQVEAVLTPEQKKQLRQFGPWWMREEE